MVVSMDAELFEKRTMQEALRELTHAYENIDQSVKALKQANAHGLAEDIDQLQDFILDAQGKILGAINERF